MRYFISNFPIYSRVSNCSLTTCKLTCLISESLGMLFSLSQKLGYANTTVNKIKKNVSSSVIWLETPTEFLLAHLPMVLFLQVRFSAKHPQCSYMPLAASGGEDLPEAIYPSLGKFLCLFLGRKLHLTTPWLGTFSAIIQSGPSKHHFVPVMRDDTRATGLEPRRCARGHKSKELCFPLSL